MLIRGEDCNQIDGFNLEYCPTLSATLAQKNCRRKNENLRYRYDFSEKGVFREGVLRERRSLVLLEFKAG